MSYTPTEAEIEKFCAAASKIWIDQGKYIEAGWAIYRIKFLPKEISAIDLRDKRWLFFAGAQHLLGGIMHMLDEGTEPTDQDMKRMDLISRELDEFYRQSRILIELPKENNHA